MQRADTRRFEQRFRTEEALAAARKLMTEAAATGLTIRPLNSEVTAIEFDDAIGEAPFSAIANNAHALMYLRQPALRKFPGLFGRATADFGRIPDNKKGEYRWRVVNAGDLDRILSWLQSEGVWPWHARGHMPQLRRDGTLPAVVLNSITSDQILNAAEQIANGFSDPRFGEHTDYEVVYKKTRLKPKALFGLAARQALGVDVAPGHFYGGLGTPCFRKIEQAGLAIVSVSEANPGAPSVRSPSRFEVGKAYTREEVAAQVGNNDYQGGGSWDTGYAFFNGEFFIFCNVGIAGRTGHKYPNRWDDGRLVWSTKPGTRLGQPQIERLISGQVPVHVFWRGQDRQPFTYAGLAVAESVNDVSPAEVTWLLDPNLSSSTKDPQGQPQWRRGPPPSAGATTLHKQDGPTSVYVMVLEGASRATFPSLPEGTQLAKIGMSNDPVRRELDLNVGFPLGCVLRWKVLRAREYATAALAYTAEGELLERFRTAGKWAGNEFIRVTRDDLDDLLM
jgi:hypothetical protein